MDGRVSVDLFESVINFSLKRFKEDATSFYFLRAGVSPSNSVTLQVLGPARPFQNGKDDFELDFDGIGIWCWF